MIKTFNPQQRGIDTVVKSYPEKPVAVDGLYQHNYCYEKPVSLGDWQWSTTFGQWGRVVTFADGSTIYTWPKLWKLSDIGLEEND